MSARLAGMFTICLLLASIASSVGAATVLGAPAAPFAPPAAAVAAFPATSCQGTEACTGVVGTVGENSCNGAYACTNAQGNIGDGSCIGAYDCQGMGSDVGDNSCNSGDVACAGGVGRVGDNSCHGAGACNSSEKGVGNNSCLGDGSCYGMTGPIGNASCTGKASVCYQSAGVGNNSCNTTGSECHGTSVGDCQFNDVAPVACLPLDARIRKLHVRNSWIGGGIRNTTADGQARSRRVAAPSTAGFGIRIQNTGPAPDSFALNVSDPDAPDCVLVCAAADTGTPGYEVHYWHRHKDITDAVVAGTFVTPALAPGEWYQLRAKVQVLGDATPDSVMRRLATFTSVGDGSSQDAIKFVVRAR